jgi:hypothetical protein
VKKSRAVEYRAIRKLPSGLERRYGEAFTQLDAALFSSTLRAHQNEEVARRTYSELRAHILLECERFRLKRWRKPMNQAAELWKQKKKSMVEIAEVARELARLLVENQDQPLVNQPLQELYQNAAISADAVAAFLDRQRRAMLDVKPSDDMVAEFLDRYADFMRTRSPTRNPHTDLNIIVNNVATSCELITHYSPDDYDHWFPRFLERLAEQLDKRRGEGAWDSETELALGPSASSGRSSAKIKPFVGTNRNLPTPGVQLAARLIALIKGYVKNGFRCIRSDGREMFAGGRSYDDVVQGFVESALKLSSDDARKCVDNAKTNWRRSRRKLDTSSP